MMAKRKVQYSPGPVVQKLGSAIHRINNFPADKYTGKSIAVSRAGDRDSVSGGYRYYPLETLGPAGVRNNY